MQEYEKRKCMVCGKEFTPRLAQIVCCSEKCQKERRNTLGRAYGSAYRKRIKETISSLENEVTHLTSINAELERKLVELQAQFKKAKSLEAPELQFHECLRCNVKATILPCGKNQICWEPDPCEKCKGMNRPRLGHMAARKNPYREEDSYFEKYKVVAE